MINAGVLFYLTTAVCSPVNDTCENAIVSFYPEKEVCEQVIIDERLFSAECLPVNGVTYRQK
jgi:hypothetical protein